MHAAARWTALDVVGATGRTPSVIAALRAHLVRTRRLVALRTSRQSGRLSDTEVILCSTLSLLLVRCFLLWLCHGFPSLRAELPCRPICASHKLSTILSLCLRLEIDSSGFSIWGRSVFRLFELPYPDLKSAASLIWWASAVPDTDLHKDSV
jgi:hypothetical protein